MVRTSHFLCDNMGSTPIENKILLNRMAEWFNALGCYLDVFFINTVGSNPTPVLLIIYIYDTGSSEVEQMSEKHCVVGSIPTLDIYIFI